MMASGALVFCIYLLGQCMFPSWVNSAVWIAITSYMCLVYQLNKETYIF